MVNLTSTFSKLYHINLLILEINFNLPKSSNLNKKNQNRKNIKFKILLVLINNKNQMMVKHLHYLIHKICILTLYNKKKWNKQTYIQRN